MTTLQKVKIAYPVLNGPHHSEADARALKEISRFFKGVSDCDGNDKHHAVLDEIVFEDGIPFVDGNGYKAIGLKYLSHNLMTLFGLIETYTSVKKGLIYCPVLISLVNKVAATNNDSPIDVAGLMVAPAGQNNHHHYAGGLVIHYLEMWNWFVDLSASGNWNIPDADVKDFSLPADYIIKGIILHDLHKTMSFSVNTKYDISKPYTKKDNSPFVYAETQIGQQVTNNTLSTYLYNKSVLPELTLHDLSALDNAEGGWAKNPSQNASVGAKVLYLLDELSGNVSGRIFAGNVSNRQNEYRQVNVNDQMIF